MFCIVPVNEYVPTLNDIFISDVFQVSPGIAVAILREVGDTSEQHMCFVDNITRSRKENSHLNRGIMLAICVAT